MIKTLSNFFLMIMLGVMISSCASGKPRLIQAVSEGHMDIVDSLLAEGVDVNEKDKELGETALMVAVQEKNVAIVRVLLAEGADVNTSDDRFGFTALLFASRGGNSEIVDLLISKGADIYLKSKHGTSALGIAIVNGHTDIVKRLREAGAK